MAPSSCLCGQVDVFEAAERYQRDGIPLIILAGKDYGSGNSRDWVAKGPYLLVNYSTHFHCPHNVITTPRLISLDSHNTLD